MRGSLLVGDGADDRPTTRRPVEALARSDRLTFRSVQGTTRHLRAAVESAAYDSAMGPSWTVRPARVEDVAQMARATVRCWQETYRGLMPDVVLDDPDFPAARERFWTVALTDERHRENRAAVAERDGELIGITTAH
jgi:hypothetical protein